MSENNGAYNTKNLRRVSVAITQDVMDEQLQIIQIDVNCVTTDIVLIPSLIPKEQRNQIKAQCYINMNTPQALDFMSKLTAVIMAKNCMDFSLIMDIIKYSIKRVDL